MMCFARFAKVVLIAGMLYILGNSVAAKANSAPKNLLPNASFELTLGQAKHDWVKNNPGYGSATNWTDMVNPLTIKLAATDQLLENMPVIEPVDDAVNGSRAVAIPFSADQPGHLTSPVVSLKPGQAYTLSVYARSDIPSAKLRLAVWNRVMDWREKPDAEGEPIPLSDDWQRYEITFNVASYFDRGAVDLLVEGEMEGKVWVDAVQLEAGPRATPFQTRYPVEVAVTADKPFSGMLHLMGEPLELNLASHTWDENPGSDNLTLRVETFAGKLVYTKEIPCPQTPGSNKEKLSLDFSLVGNFRARVYSAAGDEIGVSSYGYMFTVHPVMNDGFGETQSGAEKDDFQGILYSRDGVVHTLPAERIRLPHFAGEGGWNFTITADNKIYLMAQTSSNESAGKLMRSDDGGRTWDMLKVERNVNSVLRDGSFLCAECENEHLLLYRSEDEGQTWQRLGDPLGPFFSQWPQSGPITQLSDGTFVWPIGFKKPGLNHVTYAYRSTDAGQTWSEGYPICPTGEPSIIELASGGLLAVVRNNLMPPFGTWRAYLDDKHEDHWRLWMLQYGMAYRSKARFGDILSSVQKNVLLVDSDDGGVTWTNVRAGSRCLGEMHGSAVELPDGRIVLMHVHRVPWLNGGERARVSRDGGNTWDKETYYLSTVLTYPEYSTNCVLPPELADGKPGMILSVLGDRPRSVGVDREGMMQAVRWRPLP